MKEKSINIIYCSINNFLSIILLLVIVLEKIRSSTSHFKSIYIYENKYYIITNNEIYFYNHLTNITVNLHNFTNDEKITTEEEFKMISLDKFELHFLIVKHYVYVIKEDQYFCE